MAARLPIGLGETGTLMLFRVIAARTKLGPDKANVFVHADLVFDDDDEDTDPEEIVEWAAVGFLFTLAVLSFMPRNFAAYPSWTTDRTTRLPVPTSSTACLLGTASCARTLTMFVDAA